MCRLPLLFVLLGMLVGCGGQECKVLSSCPVRLSPTEIHLGELSGSQEIAEFSFEITNSSPETVKAHIQPGCGCTVVEQADVEIEGGGTLLVPVTFSLRGRTGPQENVIRVSCRQGDEFWPMDVSVQAEILDGWSSSPLRVVISPKGQATVTVNSSASEWSHVESIAVGDGFIFHELESTDVDSRRFRITAKESPDPTRDRGIGFRRVGRDSPFFVVPIVIR